MSLDSESLKIMQSYWNSAAETYEQNFSGTILGKVRRHAVWRDLERIFKPGENVLELSCGTGIDAVFLGWKGVHVLGCDISPRMIELARELAGKSAIASPPDFRVLATENIAEITDGPFDGAFSNFSGLNCVDDLSLVARDLGMLLKPGARFLVCMMGRFVPLEIAWFLAHGRPGRAFLRLCNARSHYDATTQLSIQRPTVTQIERQMQPAFNLVRWKGIGITVPPSYAEHLAARLPKFIQILSKIDAHIGNLPFFRNMADCVLLEFERTTAISGIYAAEE
jgi:SAM-dependent methyltransferase